MTKKQELFEQMVRKGFEPIKIFIEKNRLEESLSEEDVKKLMSNIEYNVVIWMDWLRHQNSHIANRGNDHD